MNVLESLFTELNKVQGRMTYTHVYMTNFSGL